MNFLINGILSAKVDIKTVGKISYKYLLLWIISLYLYYGNYVKLLDFTC